MASLLKDLFSLLQALLTLLFVVFLVVTRPSAATDDAASADSSADSPDELTIPRVVSLRVTLPNLGLPAGGPALPLAGTRPYSELPSFQRLAIYPRLNDQPTEPPGWKLDSAVPTSGLRSTFEGHEVEWTFGVETVPHPHLRHLRRLTVAASFEEKSLDVFPLRSSLLIELETPPATDQTFAVWTELATASDSGRDFTWSGPSLSLPHAELQVTGQEGPAVTSTLPHLRHFGSVICLSPIDPARPDVFKELELKLGTTFRGYGSHLHLSATDTNPGRIRRIALRVNGVFELVGEAKEGTHPDIRYRVQIAPTGQLPPADKSLLGPPAP